VGRVNIGLKHTQIGKTCPPLKFPPAPQVVGWAGKYRIETYSNRQDLPTIEVPTGAASKRQVRWAKFSLAIGSRSKE
jgi:hypothetical protein